MLKIGSGYILWLCMGEVGCNVRDIEEAANILVNARHAIAFTGAGISTESGIPDFRGPQGLWKQYSPEIATINYFLQHPKEFWLFYRVRMGALFIAKPNRAHRALAELESMGVIKAVITQNVDGLHQAAGSKNVIELHGTMRRAICIACGRAYPMDVVIKKIDSGQVPPLCDECGGVLKPDNNAKPRSLGWGCPATVGLSIRFIKPCLVGGWCLGWCLFLPRVSWWVDYPLFSPTRAPNPPNRGVKVSVSKMKTRGLLG